MSRFSAGISTFNSCNKAGSIPHFNEHLKSHPNDFNALMWRGRAFSIIGNQVCARNDFKQAMRNSVDPHKSLAEAHLELVNGNSERRAQILQFVTKKYPHCAEAWSELGGHYVCAQQIDTGLSMLKKAVELGKANGETKSPWYPWCNRDIGDIYLAKGNTDEARRYFTAAVESGEILTVGYLGLCNCNILERNLNKAKQYFYVARGLNPVLVPHENFEAYYHDVFDQDVLNEVFTKLELKDTVQKSGSSASSGQRTGASGSSYSSGDGKGKSENALVVWKAMQQSSTHIMEDDSNNKYVLDEDKKFWYTRDRAGHGRNGGAFLKKYENKGDRLVFCGSVDWDMKFMDRKHESRAGTIINKKDLHTVKRS